MHVGIFFNKSILVLRRKKIILIDDVFYTGRTIRSALDALLDFGRPRKIELLVLIDRRYMELAVQSLHKAFDLETA